MLNILQSDVISTIEVALELQPGALTKESRADEFEQWDSLGVL